MAGKELTITLVGEKELAAKLAKLSNTIFDLRDVMRSAGEYLAEFFQGEVFASQGGVYGRRWPDLAQGTLDQKARSKDLGAGVSPRSILQYTGQMRRSFKLMSTHTYCEISNTASYFPFAQLGTSRMPQRQIIAIDKPRKEAITKMIGDNLSQKIDNL